MTMASTDHSLPDQLYPIEPTPPEREMQILQYCLSAEGMNRTLSVLNVNVSGHKYKKKHL